MVPVLEGLRGRVERADLHRHLQGRGRRARASIWARRSSTTSARSPTTRRWPASSRGAARAVVLMHNRGRSTRHVRAGARTTTSAARSRAELADARGRRRGRRHSARPHHPRSRPGLREARRALASRCWPACRARRARLPAPRPVRHASRSSRPRSATSRRPIAVWGTAAAVTASVLLGAHIVRVHDVPEMVQVVRVADAIRIKNAALTAMGHRLDCLIAL